MKSFRGSIFLFIIVFISSTSSQNDNIIFKFKETYSNNFVFYGPNQKNVPFEKASEKCVELGFELLNFSVEGLKEETIEKFNEEWNKDNSLSGVHFWESNKKFFKIESNDVIYDDNGSSWRFICFKPKDSSLVTTNNNSPSSSSKTIITFSTISTISTTSTKFINIFSTSKQSTSFYSNQFISSTQINKNNSPNSNGVNNEEKNSNHGNKSLGIGLGVALPLIILSIVGIFFLLKFKGEEIKKKLTTKIFKSHLKSEPAMYVEVEPGKEISPPEPLQYVSVKKKDKLYENSNQNPESTNPYDQTS